MIRFVTTLSLIALLIGCTEPQSPTYNQASNAEPQSQNANTAESTDQAESPPPSSGSASEQNESTDNAQHTGTENPSDSTGNTQFFTTPNEQKTSAQPASSNAQHEASAGALEPIRECLTDRSKCYTKEDDIDPGIMSPIYNVTSAPVSPANDRPTIIPTSATPPRHTDTTETQHAAPPAPQPVPSLACDGECEHHLKAIFRFLGTIPNKSATYNRTKEIIEQFRGFYKQNIPNEHRQHTAIVVLQNMDNGVANGPLTKGATASQLCSFVNQPMNTFVNQLSKNPYMHYLEFMTKPQIEVLVVCDLLENSSR